DLSWWEGGKTGVVEGEPQGDGRRWAQATTAAAETLLEAMRPGACIKDLQALARTTYRKAGVPDPERALIFFHGLGLSHMELELMTAGGETRGGDWVFGGGLVAPGALLSPGGRVDRSGVRVACQGTAGRGRP